MSDDLRELADSAIDEDSFRRFLRALADDKADECRKEEKNPSSPYGPGANGWENGTIQAFLEAAACWADASKEGLEHYAVPSNPWTRAAHILLAGKFYE